MKPNKTIFISMAFVLIGGLVGCRSNKDEEAALGPPPPNWWHNPRQDDETNVFVKGNAKKCDTEQNARDQAYANALAMLSKRLLSNGRMTPSEVGIQTCPCHRNL